MCNVGLFVNNFIPKFKNINLFTIEIFVVYIFEISERHFKYSIEYQNKFQISLIIRKIRHNLNCIKYKTENTIFRTHSYEVEYKICIQLVTSLYQFLKRPQDSN